MDYKVDISIIARTITVWTLTSEELWSPKQVDQIKKHLAKYGDYKETPRSVIIECDTVGKTLEAYNSAQTMKI